MTTAGKMLIYRFGQIGDTVAALPALWLLRESFPQAEFTMLSEVPQNRTALSPDLVLPQGTLIQRHLHYQGGASIQNLISHLWMAFRLRQEKHDVVAYLLPSIRSSKQRKRDALFFKLAGIRRSVGFAGFPADAFPRHADGSLVTVPHEADALLYRLAQNGLPVVPPGKGRMDLDLTKEEQDHAETWWRLQGRQEEDSQRWFAVCSGTKWSSKQWPAERYAEVGRLLIEKHGLLPVVFGGKEDRELGMHLISNWGGGLCAAGELSVRESAALLRQARFYLGNDTGVMHLAAAVGTPCVAIFSALDWPGRWHPYGEGHRVLRHEVACSGCMSSICAHAHECLLGVSVGSVLAACESVINKAE